MASPLATASRGSVQQGLYAAGGFLGFSKLGLAADKRYSLELAMSESLAQCDCCDYFTIPDGSDYEICPICFWEQDAFGVSEPDEPSGANHGLSLHEGRKNFLVFGSCAVQFKANVVAVSEREKYRYAARAI